MLANITAFLAAWTETAKALSALAAWVQSQQSKQAGIDAQKVVTLEAENADLRARNTALVAAAGTPGSNRL